MSRFVADHCAFRTIHLTVDRHLPGESYIVARKGADTVATHNPWGTPLLAFADTVRVVWCTPRVTRLGPS